MVFLLLFLLIENFTHEYIWKFIEPIQFYSVYVFKAVHLGLNDLCVTLQKDWFLLSQQPLIFCIYRWSFMWFPPSTLACQLMCHCVGLVLATILLEYHGFTFHGEYKRYYLMADILVLWFLQSFCSIFCNITQVLGMGFVL